jgi:hypothetical protein
MQELYPLPDIGAYTKQIRKNTDDKDITDLV